MSCAERVGRRDLRDRGMVDEPRPLSMRSTGECPVVRAPSGGIKSTVDMVRGVAPLLKEENARRNIGFDGLGDGISVGSVFEAVAGRSVPAGRDAGFGAGTVEASSAISSSELRISISVPSPLTSFVFP